MNIKNEVQYHQYKFEHDNEGVDNLYIDEIEQESLAVSEELIQHYSNKINRLHKLIVKAINALE